MFEEAVEIRDRLAVLVDRLDPDVFSGAAARELWAVLDKSERLCAAGKTLLARRVAQTHQRCGGTRTAAEELGRRGGTTTSAAKDAVDTSARLPDQPTVDKALRGGELSPAQAALISAAVAANPSAEKRLVELAGQVSLAELREECARVRAAADPDPDATNRRLHNARCLRRYTDSEGFWNLHAKGSPQAGAAFNTMLDPIIDQIFGHARRTGRHEHPDAYAFDALMAMADQAAGGTGGGQAGQEQPADGGEQAGGQPAGDAAAADAGSGAAAGHGRSAFSGEPGGAAGDGTQASADTGVTADQPSGAAGFGTALPAGRLLGQDTTGGADPGIFAGPDRPGCPPPAASRTNPRYLALLRVDAAALRRGRVDGEELCEIAGVGPVPVSAARDLLGQAILKLVITNGTDVLNVTHLGRGQTTAQKIALLWTNPTCAVQGCNRRRIEYDHQIPWAQTRHTRLDELDPLCGFHHDLKTRLHWALVHGNGKSAFVPPEDPRHPGNRPARGRPAADNGPPGQGPAGPSIRQSMHGRPPPGRAPTSPARGPTRRRTAAAGQTSLPDPPGDPPQAA